MWLHSLQVLSEGAAGITADATIGGSRRSSAAVTRAHPVRAAALAVPAAAAAGPGLPSGYQGVADCAGGAPSSQAL
jgi:hypothetical protein